jgi:hypothetical protein
MCDEEELETGLKVVAIMQTIAEDHDETSKRMLRKILGISDFPLRNSDDTTE